MRKVNSLIGPAVLLLLLLLLAGCSQNPQGEITPAPATAEPTSEPAISPTDISPSPPPPTVVVSTATPTDVPVTAADVEQGLRLVRDFLARVSTGEFRDAYGSLLTTAGQQRLADLVLGRLALQNPHISFFEVLGAQPVDGQIAVDVMWEETYEGQGLVGKQTAQVLLDRQDGVFLVDDVLLADFEPAATPPPPPLPRAEALINPAIPGEEMQFRASGFEGSETVLAWLELPDGSLTAPSFQSTDATGAFDLVYSAATTRNLQPGRWIWWAQALRDSTRNTGITFDVLPPPTATVTPTPLPTRPPAPRPTATPRPQAAAPTATPPPARANYPAPVLLWPEPKTSREWPGALVVEFVPVAEELAADEFYELVLVARDLVGNVYNAGSVRGKGDPCTTIYSQPCRTLSTDSNFMRLFYPSGVDGQGTWYVQVVRQTGPDQFTPMSPPSEQRSVTLKSR